MTTSAIYQICISGWLDASWADWFEGLIIRHTEDGMTTLTGPLPDQAALHGVLNKIRDLGLTLLTVTTETAADANDEDSSE